MNLDPKEQQHGAVWFFAALCIGITLTISLATIDIKLTSSNNELKHAEKMRELRIAQTSIASVDSRTK